MNTVPKKHPLLRMNPRVAIFAFWLAVALAITLAYYVEIPDCLKLVSIPTARFLIGSFYFFGINLVGLVILAILLMMGVAKWG